MDFRELYEEVILDHGKNPRNLNLLEHYNREGHGHNPLCGDKIVLRLQLDDDTITEIGFVGQGCVISQASCSTMTEAVKGKTVQEVELLFEQFHRLVTTGDSVDIDSLGKLAVFAGVSEFPMRVKCTTLGWHTLKHSIHNGGQTTTTTE